MCKRLLALLLFLIISVSTQAQRVSYPELYYRTQLPTIFIDDLILPGDSSQTTLVFTFRFNNDFLPYKKIPLKNDLNMPEEAQFYTTIRLNSEIFEGSTKKRRESEMRSVYRDMWSDTLFTKNFEETQSDDIYASGSLSAKLQPGVYNYILQLSMMQEQSERNTQRRDIRIPDLKTKETGEIYLIRNSDQAEEPVLELMNMNENVPFGENFFALIRIPNYDAQTNYSVNIHKAKISRRDTTAEEEILKLPVSDGQVYENATLQLQKGNQPKLRLISQNDAFSYVLMEIPNETLENSAYFLQLRREGEKKPLAEEFFKSYWPDMPASLYNLSIATDMLKFIVGKDELNKLKSGSAEERERKFREFWESKDPTPNTVYNELMAEYYRRIDYAYKEFGSQENPMGHESDQGEIYIKFGPPDSKERLYPTNERVREVWHYPDRTFVFEASSGFGDFVLIGTKQ